MRKLVNRVDHVAYICEYANIAAHVAEVEKVLDITLEHFDRTDMGLVVYYNMAAGIEVVAPLPARTAANEAFYARLETQGEGVLGVVFGVKGLDDHKARLEAMGYGVGDLIDQSHSPWRDKVTLRQRPVPSLVNCLMLLGENEYAEDMLDIEES